MSAHPLLPDPALLTLESVRIENGIIVFAARTLAVSANCPFCGHLSERVHSRYRRTLLDLPWQGNAVRIVLGVRRFFCDNYSCERRIFAERLSQVAEHYSRKTCRLAQALRELAFLAGGEAAARIARTFGLLISPDALLKNLRCLPPTPAPTPRVLGVDDFAFRRGHRYGTILVDLERHCPVDLLADREADTLSRWLKEHPGVQVVSRDRADAFRNGITSGAPEAVQIADRWHLLKNLGDALERFLLRHHRHLAQTARQLLTEEMEAAQTTESSAPAADAEENPPPPLVQQRRLHSRQRREALYRHVHELYEQGFSKLSIARQTGLDGKTIRKYLRSPTCPYYPESRHRSPAKANLLTPFHDYLEQRWREGCHNAATLLEEIRQRGYRGGYTLLKVHLHPWRAQQSGMKQATIHFPDNRVRVPGPAMVRWWLLGHCRCCRGSADGRTEEQRRRFVDVLVSLLPQAGEFQALAQEFTRVVKGESPDTTFNDWTDKARQSAVPELRSFARGLLQDEAAVRAALASQWSNGQTEGQVNRLKFIKRSMYGRGSFDLLRARVLHQSAA